MKDYEVGNYVKFSGASGSSRTGHITKIWSDPQGHKWSEVKCDKALFLWEVGDDLIFVVSLEPTYCDHAKCIVHG